MAIDLRGNRGPRRDGERLLADVGRVQSSLQGHCFAGLNFLQRAATYVGIKLALLGTAGGARVELRENSWSLRDRAVDPVMTAVVPAPAAPELAKPLASRIADAYKADFDSQRARMALRGPSPEADDCYFEPAPGEDDFEYSPVLQRFRERTAFQLLGT